eukprot:COSAG05_NODE_8170_length_729_cov_1.225397_1_plen_75_part_10
MEFLKHSLFKGKKNAKNAVGSYRLHSKADDSYCLSVGAGDNCAKYLWKKCRSAPSDTDNQVFHVSRFVDDKDDTD